MTLSNSNQNVELELKAFTNLHKGTFCFVSQFENIMIFKSDFHYVFHQFLIAPGSERTKKTGVCLREHRDILKTINSFVLDAMLIAAACYTSRLSATS